MKKTLFKIFDKFTEKVDTYHNNGSMWFIFTDEKKWVIELTKEGTLWYNFYFFQDCFKYLSLDVVENQHYITEWVEDTIQNGVRHTATLKTRLSFSVEDAIQNGIKEINHCSVSNDENAKNATEFGIKITLKSESSYPEMIEKVIKETHEDVYHNKGRVDGVIRKGIKETKGIGPSEVTTKEIENVIKVKPTLESHQGFTVGSPYVDKFFTQSDIIDTIQNGIKETIELPDKSGELNGYGEYYARQKNMTYPHTDIVNDVITDGIKETNWRKVDNHPTYLDHILIEK